MRRRARCGSPAIHLECAFPELGLQIGRGLGTRAAGLRVPLREIEVPPLDVGRAEKLLNDPVLQAEQSPDLVLCIRSVRKRAADGRDYRCRVAQAGWVASVAMPPQMFMTNHEELFPRWSARRPRARTTQQATALSPETTDPTEQFVNIIRTSTR
jgi:hypothetical protein